MYNFSHFDKKTLNSANVLLILPPFAYIETPSIGLHILQACAKASGYSVHICYLNIAFAHIIGYKNYKIMCGSSEDMIGEMFFANVAYKTSPFNNPQSDIKQCLKKLSPYDDNVYDVDDIHRIYLQLEEWLDKITDDLLQFDYKIVGCSTTFNQTAASIALLDRIKSKNPNITTIMGGANCEGDMAEGILSLSDNIDYVFSGKSEGSFPNFLEEYFQLTPPTNQIIKSTEPINIDDIPMPNYSDYYKQLHHFGFNEEIPKEKILLPYETSRGCWWGQKHQCNFCGLNGHDIEFTEKCCDKIINELSLLLEEHPSSTVSMVDNIMPYNYVDTLMPLLEKHLPGIELFYEIKANVSLETLMKLKNAGVSHLQPGIEALSTSLLKKMSKGTTAKLNIQYLKHARTLDLDTSWNLLYGIPGDEFREYEMTLNLLPLITHLEPPSVISPISIQRFSTYYENSQRFGISDLSPHPCYERILPKRANISKLTYDFIGNFKHYSDSNAQLILEIKSFVDKWQRMWQSNTPPILHLKKVSCSKYLLKDTRDLPGNKPMQILSDRQALAATKDRRITKVKGLEKEIQWAKDNKLIVELDGWFISLITAAPQLLLELKNDLF